VLADRVRPTTPVITTAGRPNAERSTSESSAAASVAKLGESLRDGKFEFVVSGLECGIRRIGSDYLNEEAQGPFCVVSSSVRNIGDEPPTFFGSN
jgi:uncharacterized protein DUF4352